MSDHSKRLIVAAQDVIEARAAADSLLERDDLPVTYGERWGPVKYDRVFLSLASDFEGARVRLAIGKPGAFNVEDDLAVPAGRSVVRELKPGDEVASIIHERGQPVAVLIEYQGL